MVYSIRSKSRSIISSMAALKTSVESTFASSPINRPAGSKTNGPSETNAALEFAVNTLEVQNILVIGHSDCGGIQALMRMQDDVDSRQSLTENWVVNAKVAKFRTKAYTAHLSFDQQCRHCEKESISRSILNLLTYPWIEERVRKELLFIHGGYYDLLNCTFEKWTLDYKGSKVDEEEVGRHSIKDHSFWS
ncbi:hypothetical protein CUMW_059930 [Citrus unshiu]|uniref:Carbonic anhydrase n=1 Tax=Citrus unshiu TaxID=55188 RepID=A0A2H5NMW2_CITUN|nr:hypothetical protein CUMW_059930 [Citrus unshiu]